MATKVIDEGSGPNKYHHITPPHCWQRGWGAVPKETYVKTFVGREGEDIRIYDHTSKTYVQQPGPAVEIPLAPMDKNEYKELKDAADALTGRVHFYQVKVKDKDAGHGAKQIYAGALWLPN